MACASNGVGCVAGEAGAGAGATVVQSLQTNSQMAAIVRLKPPHVILSRFLECSRGVRADAGTPVTVSVVLRW